MRFKTGAPMTTSLKLSKSDLDVSVYAIDCSKLYEKSGKWLAEKKRFEPGVYAVSVSGLSQSQPNIYASVRLKAMGFEILKSYARWSLNQSRSNNTRVLYFEVETGFSGSIELLLNATKPLDWGFIFKPELDLVRVCELQNFVDEVFVINLDRRKDRLLRVASQLSQFNIPWTRVSAFDGMQQPCLDEWRAYAGVKFSRLTEKTKEDIRLGRKAIYSSGAWAYLKTYIRLLEDCIAAKKETIAIFDDDACLHREFPYHFSKALELHSKEIESADVFFLGQTHLDGALNTANLVEKPPVMSCGSFALILRGRAISDLLGKLKSLEHPVDGEPLRSLIREGRTLKFTKNLVVVPLDDSDIQPARDNQSFSAKQGWNLDQYSFDLRIDREEKTILHKEGQYCSKPYSLGVSSRDRFEYLENFLRSWEKTRDKSRFCELVIADSSADKRSLHEKLSCLFQELVPLNCRISLIQTHHSSITRQTNIIFREFEASVLPETSMLFVANDDLVFERSGWESLYEDAASKSGYSHLVFFDKNWGSKTKLLGEKESVSAYTDWRSAQGAFFTVNRQILRQVGKFDEALFPAKGGGHLQFTRRCVDAGFNLRDTLFDATGSNEYLKLQPREGYLPTGGFLEYKQQLQVNSQSAVLSLEDRLMSESTQD